MKQKDKELYIMTIIVVIFIVSIGTITNYSLLPTVLAGVIGGVLGKIIIEIIKKNIQSKLLSIIEEYLNGRIRAKQFRSKFSSFVVKNEENIISLFSKDYYELIKVLQVDLAYFEPNKLLREENDSYFDEIELIKKVRKSYKKLQKLNKN